MNDNNVKHDVTPTDNQVEHTVFEKQATPTKPQNTHKTMRIVLIVAGVVILGLIIAIVSLLSRKPVTTNANGGSDSSKTANANNTASGNGSNTSDSTQQVIARQKLSSGDDNLELVIHKIEQTDAMTTVRMGIRNACNGCTDSVNVNPRHELDFSKTETYLLDSNNGKQYFPIVNADGDVVGTPSEWNSVKPGDEYPFFISYAKVPSGAMVSFVSGSTRIDDIRLP